METLNVFKSYDIRGIYPEEITEKFAYRLGKAFVIFLNSKKVVIGHDARIGSISLKKALIKGILEQGADVIDIGLTPTDMFYFAYHHFRADGIMITASHNPKEYNGFKMERKNGLPVSEGTGIEELRTLFIKNKFPQSYRKGGITHKNVLNDFVDFVFGFVNREKIKALKVVVDCSNGAAGVIAKKIFSNLPCKVIPLFWKPDGNFLNHGPNPSIAENRQQLVEAVIKSKADLGIVFDADADRCLFVDEHGDFCEPDFILGLLMRKNVSKGQSAVYELTCSTYVKEMIQKQKCKSFISKVGRTNIKRKMIAAKAVFGGEKSGHYYYKKGNFYFDNAWIRALQVLKLISETHKSLAELLEYPRMHYFLSGTLNFTVKDKDDVFKKIKAGFKDGKQSMLDGLSVDYPGWRFNIRASNTEPVVRVNVEAKTRELLIQKQEIIQMLLG